MTDLLNIQQTLEKGRHITAASKIRKGTLILKEIVQVAALDAEHLHSNCSFCYQKKAKFKCSVCQLLYYCSKKCQGKDWAIHKKECPGFATIKPRVPTSYMRLVGRLMILMKDRNYATKIELLVANKNSQSTESIYKFSEMAQAMLLYVGEEYKLPLQDVVELFCKATTNAIGLSDSFFEYSGYAISFEASLLNHSCIPNANVYFVDNLLQVRVFKDMEEGEELTLSYLEGLEKKSERKRKLKDGYAFECKCSLCADATDGGLSSFYCPEKGCTGLVISDEPLSTMNCSKCGILSVESSMILKKYRGSIEMTLRNLETADLSKLLKLVKEIAPIENALYNDAFGRVALESREHLSSEIALLLAAHLERHYCKTAPQLMSVYAKLANGFALSPRTYLESIEYYEKTLNVIDYTVGKDHPYRHVINSELMELVGEMTRLKEC